MPSLSQAEWESILALATKWRMSDLCDFATGNLPSGVMSAERRILFGREYGIRDWVRSGYTDLAVREKPLALDHFRLLGCKTALNLSQRVRREQLRKAAKERGFHGFISTTFAKEFRGLKPTISNVEEVLLARKCGITEWLAKTYYDLVKREEDITVEEAEKLGMDTAVRLCALRERFKTQKVFSDLETAVQGLHQDGLGEIHLGREMSIRDEIPGFPVNI
jgi:hypothetical protein